VGGQLRTMSHIIFVEPARALSRSPSHLRKVPRYRVAVVLFLALIMNVSWCYAETPITLSCDLMQGCMVHQTFENCVGLGYQTGRPDHHVTKTVRIYLGKKQATVDDMAAPMLQADDQHYEARASAFHLTVDRVTGEAKLFTFDGIFHFVAEGKCTKISGKPIL